MISLVNRSECRAYGRGVNLNLLHLLCRELPRDYISDSVVIIVHPLILQSSLLLPRHLLLVDGNVWSLLIWVHLISSMGVWREELLLFSAGESE